jgi:hypothetical protein
MTRLFAYRGSRWFLTLLALDISLTLVLLAAVGPAYMEWRQERPWLLPLTLAPIVVLWWRRTR